MEAPAYLADDEIKVIVVAVARFQSNDNGPPFPVPDISRTERVVQWAREVRMLGSLLNLVLDGRMLVDFDPELDDIVTRLASP